MVKCVIFLDRVFPEVKCIAQWLLLLLRRIQYMLHRVHSSYLLSYEQMIMVGNKKKQTLSVNYFSQL